MMSAFFMTVIPNQGAACSAYVCAIAMIVWPAWLIWRQRRFWSAFFYGWFLMVIGQWFAVEAGRGLPNWSDSTTVGLTLFSGWMIVLPYCGLIELVRRLYRRGQNTE
jgi:hypothetical protein